jgi:hypothetical protein
MHVAVAFSMMLSALESSSVSHETTMVAEVASIGSPSSSTVTETEIPPSSTPVACAT